MTLTPQEIQTQEFHVRFRGFDVEEVDSFLERVAEDFLALVAENKKLAAQVESLTDEMATYRSQEKTFQHAILSAQQIADVMKEKSRQEADHLIGKARQEATAIKDAANAEIAALEVEVDRLERLQAEVKEELRHQLHHYLDMLDRPHEELPPHETSADDLVPSVEIQAPPAERDEEEPAAADDEPINDLSDLYQRIELPEEPIGAMLNEAVNAVAEEEEGAAAPGLVADPAADQDEEWSEPQVTMAEEKEEPVTNIPDLDDDVVFSLEDPLDRPEPSVSFDFEEEGERKK